MGANKGIGPLVGSIKVTVKKDMGFGRVNKPIESAVVELISNFGTRVALTNIQGEATIVTTGLTGLFLVRVSAPEVSNNFLQITDIIDEVNGNNLEFTF